LPHGFIPSSHVFLTQIGRAVLTQFLRNPARVATFVGALAVVGAGGAFAVAASAPDDAAMPTREVVEAVELPNLGASVGVLSGMSTLSAPNTLVGAMDAGTLPGTLDIGALTLYRSDTTRSSDTADTLLRRLGIDDTAAAAFLRTDALTRKSLWGRAGRSITAEANADHSLKKFVARWTPTDDGSFSRLVVEQTQSGLKSRVETAPLTATVRLASGTINSSLFAATDDAKLPDSIGVQIAEIFSADIDFHRALRKGDRFSITYEALEGDGEPMRAGRVLSAEFVNNGKKYQAMWFAAQDGKADAKIDGKLSGKQKGTYYTLDGKSLNRAFLASPLEFSRVTSGFKMRLHPILQTWKQHLGVDYAAPTGTAVRSIGDGTVDFAGVQRGFGNVVIVDHGKGNQTVYAHLSRIDVRKGEKINQSQHLGAVGSTGWSTGPHLHFEFRVNGVHQDPLTMAQQAQSKELAAEAKQQFDALSSQVRVALAAAASTRRGTAE
jgi:murein DD-endopeptidase MepM/ murein hydrolase activator NlpD